MNQAVAFRTRARTIDHLGRGQIADAPTAISELWKNAYDAYARNVALHIFDADPPIAAIFDDGVGMNRDEVLDRWLVIGTENKIEDVAPTPTKTLGLPIRPRQGEKGIGRLSVAFLAPGTVLVTKRAGSAFVVVVVDWRLFENPFLALDDIRLPVGEFESAEALAKGLPSLWDMLVENLGNQGSKRGRRLRSSWKRFSEYEKEHGLGLTDEAIKQSWKTVPLAQQHFEEWPVFLELADHGTAMFMVDLNHELRVWVRSGETGDEVDEVKERLRQTLTGFTDPYSDQRPEFDYEVFCHRGEQITRVLGATDVFGLDDVHGLEHYIDGSFDERGTFTGRVVAFGEDLGVQTYVPKRPPPVHGRYRLGPFAFAIGTFEMDERRSTHNENQHALLVAQTEKFSGVAVYRDFLRVMPYGRPDADFLGMEERRSKSAGREFWAHRRSFGRIGVTRSVNRALMDKAGREGLVDNRAFREMRLLVVDLLKDSARKYFGSDSSIREDLLPGIMERKALQKDAAMKARTRRRRSMRQFLREQSAPLDQAVKRTENLMAFASEVLAKRDRTQATVLSARANELRLLGEELRPPVPPVRLGVLEEQWRGYRDGYAALSENLGKLARLTAEVDAGLEGETREEVVRKRHEQRSSELESLLNGFLVIIHSKLDELREIWVQHMIVDVGLFALRTGDLLNTTFKGGNLLSSLNMLDANATELGEVFSAKYLPFLDVLDQLIEGIDLEGAYAVTEDDRAELDEKLRDMYAVAQIGITVEIIGHEFETLESEVRRNLNKLPKGAKSTQAFSDAMRSHLALADQLRFLSPMKIGGYRSRERITGKQIADYLGEFFRRTFDEKRIEFVPTEEFERISIVDIPSRIYPVFINLLNNAVHWVSLAEEREIRLGFESGLAVVSDTGPGVDVEDESRIFDIFFSRRRTGRGVGLYLCRANLAVAGHKIRYSTLNDPKLLDGANFVIDFKGVRREHRGQSLTCASTRWTTFSNRMSIRVRRCLDRDGVSPRSAPQPAQASTAATSVVVTVRLWRKIDG